MSYFSHLVFDRPAGNPVRTGLLLDLCKPDVLYLRAVGAPSFATWGKFEGVDVTGEDVVVADGLRAVSSFSSTGSPSQDTLVIAAWRLSMQQQLLQILADVRQAGSLLVPINPDEYRLL